MLERLSRSSRRGEFADDPLAPDRVRRGMEDVLDGFGELESEKSETAGFSGLSVHHHRDFLDDAEMREISTQISRFRRGRQTADEKLFDPVRIANVGDRVNYNFVHSRGSHENGEKNLRCLRVGFIDEAKEQSLRFGLCRAFAEL